MKQLRGINPCIRIMSFGIMTAKTKRFKVDTDCLACETHYTPFGGLKVKAESQKSKERRSLESWKLQIGPHIVAAVGTVLHNCCVSKSSIWSIKAKLAWRTFCLRLAVLHRGNLCVYLCLWVCPSGIPQHHPTVSPSSLGLQHCFCFCFCSALPAMRPVLPAIYVPVRYRQQLTS